MTLEAAVGGMGGGATEPAATPAIAATPAATAGMKAWALLTANRLPAVAMAAMILLGFMSLS